MRIANRILRAFICLILLINLMLILSEATPETPFVITLENKNNDYNFTTTKTLLQNTVDEHERIKEEEAKKQAELEEQKRIEEELRLAEEARLKEEQEANRIYCTFEVSFYTTADDEGGPIGANGDILQPWVSVALPKDIPFYSTVVIDGLGEFINHDTGSYIKWTNDGICRVDVCVNSKSEAEKLGRYNTSGYIQLNE